MRIVRLKIAPDVKTLLAIEAKAFGFDDPGFVEDMYALMKFRGNGLPDKARIKFLSTALSVKYKQSVIGFNLLLTKRKMLLDKLSKIPLFPALAQLSDRIEACRRILQNFSDMHRKTRQAQCITCHLLTKCQFGKQYSKVMQDITKVIDPDYDTKVHDDCPARPVRD